jgi:hypothetical protein
MRRSEISRLPRDGSLATLRIATGMALYDSRSPITVACRGG